MSEMTEQEALEVVRQRDYCQIHLIPMVEDKSRHLEYVGPKYCQRCRWDKERADKQVLDTALDILRKRSPR